MPTPRSPYRLRELTQAGKDMFVFVTEGEKVADAAVACGLLATTSAGGSNAADKTDWTSLGGRHVVTLPDNDQAGEACAADAARLCRAAGAASVRISRLADYAPGLPVGGDLADTLAADDWCGVGVGEARVGDGAKPADWASCWCDRLNKSSQSRPNLCLPSYGWNRSGWTVSRSWFVLSLSKQRQRLDTIRPEWLC
jgi:hypothetical protein